MHPGGPVFHALFGVLVALAVAHALLAWRRGNLRGEASRLAVVLLVAAAWAVYSAGFALAAVVVLALAVAAAALAFVEARREPAAA